MKKLTCFFLVFSVFLIGCQEENIQEPIDDSPVLDNNNGNGNVNNELYIQGEGVTDIDGNFYPSIIINGQEWTQKNLTVARYNNGDSIQSGLSDADWEAATTGAFSVYENNMINDSLYGKLYNWYCAVDSRGLCPIGWHLPNDLEWNQLINFLDSTADGGSIYPNVAGGKMKSGLYWNPTNYGTSNLSGFTGFPGGKRFYLGNYTSEGFWGTWWSSDENIGSPNIANSRSLFNGYYAVLQEYNIKLNGLSVRCVKN